jgi:phage shock protein A
MSVQTRDWRRRITVAELKLISNRKEIKSLVQAALVNEQHLLEAGLRRTEEKLAEFEAKYKLSTKEFISRFENDEMEESLDLSEWMGESKMWERLREKIETLKDVQIAN